MGRELRRMAGGLGCDIVTSADGSFTARTINGVPTRIYAIFIRADDTTIEWVIEDNVNHRTTITSRSWIGGANSAAFVHLNKGEWYFPDFPVKQLEVGAGSIIVYYDRNFIVK